MSNETDLAVNELRALRVFIDQRIKDLESVKVLQDQGPVLPYKEIKPEKPVSVDNKPISWLKGRISVIREKHTQAKIEWMEDKGMLQKIVIRATESELGETAKDIENPAKWAFRRALEGKDGGTP